MKKILITRSKNKAKKLGDYLKNNNYQIFFQPLFTVKKTTPQLNSPIKNSPIIITSANAVWFLEHSKIDTSCPIYAVGKKTADLILKKGYEKVFYPQLSSAKNLKQLILKNLSPQEIYYFHGEKISFDFKINLQKHGYIVNDFKVYKTAEIKNFSPTLINNIEEKIFDNILIFSLNSLEIFYHQCVKHNLIDYFNLSIIMCYSKEIAMKAKFFGFKNIKIFNNDPLLKYYYEH